MAVSTAVTTTVTILKMVEWAKLIEEAPALLRQASTAADNVSKLLSDLRKPSQKKESVADAIARLSGEVEALAANQQQLADVLTEASARQQTIVAKVAQTRRIMFVTGGVGCANLVLLAALLLTR